MVRLYARETSVTLGKIFEEMKNSTKEEKGISNDFAAQAEEKLDDIFQD
jgi:hypothetical protein